VQIDQLRSVQVAYKIARASAEKIDHRCGNCFTITAESEVRYASEGLEDLKALKVLKTFTLIFAAFVYHS
jgi:hypothetical protein